MFEEQLDEISQTLAASNITNFCYFKSKAADAAVCATKYCRKLPND